MDAEVKDEKGFLSCWWVAPTCPSILKFFKKNLGPTEITQGFRALAVLIEDSSLVPSYYTEWLPTACNSSFGEPTLSVTCHMHSDPHVYM